jgi:hypothetical protein
MATAICDTKPTLAFSETLLTETMTSSWRDHQGVTAFDDVIKFTRFPKPPSGATNSNKEEPHNCLFSLERKSRKCASP